MAQQANALPLPAFIWPHVSKVALLDGSQLLSAEAGIVVVHNLRAC